MRGKSFYAAKILALLILVAFLGQGVLYVDVMADDECTNLGEDAVLSSVLDEWVSEPQQELGNDEDKNEETPEYAWTMEDTSAEEVEDNDTEVLEDAPEDAKDDTGVEIEAEDTFMGGTTENGSGEKSEALIEGTKEELQTAVDAEFASDIAVDEDGVSLYPMGTAPSTLWDDDVTGSVAEAGYFPSKWEILRNRIPGIYTASMITWHRNNGAECYRIKDTTIFAETLGGTPAYSPKAGDLIYYQTYQSEYDRGIIASGNGNWLHVGIVAEEGENYILTIEGNLYQRVGQSIFYTYDYEDGWHTFSKSWIVNVFGEDEDARRAFVNTAWSAWYESETDAYYGFCGLDSWRESEYNGVYQNDTIASGYYRLPAAWCEMFVLWCAFHADIQRTGSINLRLLSVGRRVLPTVISHYPALDGYVFEVYDYREDGQYDGIYAAYLAETE